MKIPTTYSEWINAFEQLKEGTNDEEVISTLEKGTIEWTIGVSSRITERLYEAVEYRLQQLNDQLNKNFKQAKDRNGYIKALLDARKRFALINRAANLQTFPTEVRTTLTGIVKDVATNMHQSMIDSAEEDRSGMLKTIIKNNSILAYDKENVQINSVSLDEPKNISTGPYKTRRVILP